MELCEVLIFLKDTALRASKINLLQNRGLATTYMSLQMRQTVNLTSIDELLT